MQKGQRNLTDQSGWLTVHRQAPAAEGAAPAPPSRPRRVWATLLGTVISFMKEQGGAVQSFVCIRGAVVFKHHTAEAHIVEIVLPSARSVLLEVDGQLELKAWLPALTAAVGADGAWRAKINAQRVGYNRTLHARNYGGDLKANATNSAEAKKDLVWAILNSREFLFQH